MFKNSGSISMNPLNKFVLPTTNQSFIARFYCSYSGSFLYFPPFSFIISISSLAWYFIHQGFILIMLRKLDNSLICEWNQLKLDFSMYNSFWAFSASISLRMVSNLWWSYYAGTNYTHTIMSLFSLINL